MHSFLGPLLMDTMTKIKNRGMRNGRRNFLCLYLKYPMGVTLERIFIWGRFPHLSSLCLVAHKAFTESLHLSRFAASVFPSSHDRHPASALSFSTVRLQVVFGLPLLLFTKKTNFTKSFENLDIPVEIVLFLGNFGKCCSIR